MTKDDYSRLIERLMQAISLHTQIVAQNPQSLAELEQLGQLYYGRDIWAVVQEIDARLNDLQEGSLALHPIDYPTDKDCKEKTWLLFRDAERGGFVHERQHTANGAVFSVVTFGSDKYFSSHRKEDAVEFVDAKMRLQSFFSRVAAILDNIHTRYDERVKDTFELNDKEREYFEKAIKKGFMQVTGNGGYKWTYSPPKASLAYFLKRVFNPDGCSTIPYQRLEAMFRVKRLDAAVYALGDRDKQKWEGKIDYLFDNMGV